MKILHTLTLGTAALFAAMALSPIAAYADGKSTQKNKNQWRNLGAGAAAVAGYGLLKGNSTATLLGAAGAAYSANRYEQERKSQDQAKRAHQRYYHNGGNYVHNGRKYYRYQGHLYYMNLSNGSRHRVN
jgi:uncharacterized protein YcfJ